MRLVFIGIIGLFISSCTTVAYDLHAQSHYAYPNSNIIPLGEAVGQASQTTFFTPPQLSGAVERQAVAAALQTKPGADLLLNYVSEAKLITVWFIFIFDYTVHGTAAKMEVGGKPLR